MPECWRVCPTGANDRRAAARPRRPHGGSAATGDGRPEGESRPIGFGSRFLLAAAARRGALPRSAILPGTRRQRPFSRSGAEGNGGRPPRGQRARRRRQPQPNPRPWRPSRREPNRKKNGAKRHTALPERSESERSERGVGGQGKLGPLGRTGGGGGPRQTASAEPGRLVAV